MLAVTDRASAASCEIIGEPNAETGAGLRISSDPVAGSVRLSVSAAPLHGDAVVESNGARVFIEPKIVPILDDKLLDVEPDGDATVGMWFLNHPGLTTGGKSRSRKAKACWSG